MCGKRPIITLCLLASLLGLPAVSPAQQPKQKEPIKQESSYEEVYQRVVHSPIDLDLGSKTLMFRGIKKRFDDKTAYKDPEDYYKEWQIAETHSLLRPISDWGRDDGIFIKKLNPIPTRFYEFDKLWKKDVFEYYGTELQRFVEKASKAVTGKEFESEVPGIKIEVVMKSFDEVQQEMDQYQENSGGNFKTYYDEDNKCFVYRILVSTGMFHKVAYIIIHERFHIGLGAPLQMANEAGATDLTRLFCKTIIQNSNMARQSYESKYYYPPYKGKFHFVADEMCNIFESLGAEPGNLYQFLADPNIFDQELYFDMIKKSEKKFLSSSH